MDLFVDLLYRMGESVGYSFNKVDLKNAMYFPVGHGEWEEDSFAIRKGVLVILNGKSEILVRLSQNSGEEKKQS